MDIITQWVSQHSGYHTTVVIICTVVITAEWVSHHSGYHLHGGFHSRVVITAEWVSPAKILIVTPQRDSCCFCLCRLPYPIPIPILVNQLALNILPCKSNFFSAQCELGVFSYHIQNSSELIYSIFTAPFLAKSSVIIFFTSGFQKKIFFLSQLVRLAQQLTILKFVHF